jgi:hypothetical protein
MNTPVVHDENGGIGEKEGFEVQHPPGDHKTVVPGEAD